MPKKIGVVTSLSGAAVRDIINVLTRRYPLCEVYAVNAVVQGEDSSHSICRGISNADNAGCDVIIVGRGGGSSEDLSAFNTESVAYAIYNSSVPVISAVGHETDFTIADLTADMRAPTPSAAAELASPMIDNIYERIDVLEKNIKNALCRKINNAADELSRLDSRLAAQSPEKRLRYTSEQLNTLDIRCRAAFRRYTDDLSSKLLRDTARLEALSPLKILSRGYSLAYKENVLIKDSSALSEGDVVTLRFGSGSAEAEIRRKW